MSVQAPAEVAEAVRTVAQHCSGVLLHSPHHLKYDMYNVLLLCTVLTKLKLSYNFHHSGGTALEPIG